MALIVVKTAVEQVAVIHADSTPAHCVQRPSSSRPTWSVMSEHIQESAHLLAHIVHTVRHGKTISTSISVRTQERSHLLVLSALSELLSEAAWMGIYGSITLETPSRHVQLWITCEAECMQLITCT